ncbi:MAG TPA: glycosyltransferase family 92 protein [Chlamydiales bacterium]|nr:glycosyltransferase family 92 protein [Chlamydiales bacterium]
MFLFVCSVFAAPSPPKKYNLSVCALFKNEAPYLREWVEYHRLIGIDHFYLYNSESLDPFRRVLGPYIRSGIVTLIHWPDWAPADSENEDRSFIWPLLIQTTAYENAIKWEALEETKWLVILDIDEFLVLPPEYTIQEILKRYDEYPGIILTSEFFDASKKDALPPRKLVIESLEITAPAERDIQRCVEKTIFKPALCTFFYWPPYRCHFKDGIAAARVGKRELRINHYEDRMRFKSIDKVKRKVSPDRKISDEEIQNYLEKGFEVEDPDRFIYRYVPEVRKKMGF